MWNSTHALKTYLCFYKNSTIQTFTLISSKVVYFKKHITYLAYLNPREMKCPLPLNVSNPCQTIKVAAGEMTEPVHTFLKDMFRNLLFECISKDNYINGLK